LAGGRGARAEPLALAAQALAALDAATALADLAAGERWCRPLVDDSGAFDVRQGRHPVVEAALARGHDAAFVPNDCDLSERQRLWLVTGPNMAGEKTLPPRT